MLRLRFTVYKNNSDQNRKKCVETAILKGAKKGCLKKTSSANVHSLSVLSEIHGLRGRPLVTPERGWFEVIDLTKLDEEIFDFSFTKRN